MPELSDVEIRKRYLDSTGLHQKIEAVEVNDSIVLDGLTPAALGKALADHSFESTRRHGKHLFVELCEGSWLGMHFGMTGEVYNSMKEVFETAIEHNSEPAQYPDSYLIHHRSDGELCPRCGGDVQKIEVAGRSGYYCPDCQER